MRDRIKVRKKKMHLGVQYNLAQIRAPLWELGQFS